MNPKTAQIWLSRFEQTHPALDVTFKAESFIYPVLITDMGNKNINKNNNIIRVIPLFYNIMNNDFYDSLFKKFPVVIQENQVPWWEFKVIPEYFNEVPMLESGLKEYRGTLHDNIYNKIIEFRNKFYNDNIIIENESNDFKNWIQQELIGVEYLTAPVNLLL